MGWQLDKGKPPKDIEVSSPLKQLKSAEIRNTIFFRPVDLGGSAKSEEHWNLWLKRFKDAENNIGELQLIHKMFQNNFGREGTLRPSRDYSRFIENYNRQSDKCAKEVALLNAQIDEYNKNLPQGEPKVEKLSQPPKLEFLETASKGSNKRSHQSDTGIPRKEYGAKEVSPHDKSPEHPSWLSPETVTEAATTFMKVANKLNPKTVMRLMGLGATVLALASQRVEAATIHGSNCSLDSALFIKNNNASLDLLASRLHRQFEDVFPLLVKDFAQKPCDPNLSNVTLTLAPIDNPNVSDLIDKNNASISFDPAKHGGPNPDNSIPEGALTYDLATIAQNYTGLTEADSWLENAMARYAQNEYGPKDQVDRGKLELGSCYTMDDKVAADFLSWLVNNAPLKEGLNTTSIEENGTKVDFSLKKNGTIVDVFNQALQLGISSYAITHGLFEATTNQSSFDEAWKEYFKSQFKIPTQTQTITDIEFQIITQIATITQTETEVSCSQSTKAGYTTLGIIASIGLASIGGIIYCLRRDIRRGWDNRIQTLPQNTETGNTDRTTTEQISGSGGDGQIEMGPMGAREQNNRIQNPLQNTGTDNTSRITTQQISGERHSRGDGQQQNGGRDGHNS